LLPSKPVDYVNNFLTAMDPPPNIDNAAPTTHSQRTPTAAIAPPATARDYYNAPSTDTFYHTLWGGDHIHIGTYLTPSDPLALASARTVSRMAALLGPFLTPATRVLDLGAGYGGAARWLARHYGCHVTCLNISEVQNARNRAKNKEQGLEALVQVVDGTFEHLPFGEGAFELVWCQDCLLHAGDREVVVKEVARVLVPRGARVLLSDHLAVEGATEERVRPIRERLALKGGLATRGFYERAFEKWGFVEVGFADGTQHMVTHCGKVVAAIEEAERLGSSDISGAVAENAKTGMAQWIEGGKQGYLEWGIFHFRR